MQMNPIAVPTFVFALIAFWIGTRAEGFLQDRRARIVVVVVSIILALPALLFVLYYTHLFDNATWFYNFRAIRFTELLVSGTGFLTGFVYSFTEPESIGEKLAIPAILFILVAIPFIKPVITPLDLTQLSDRCVDDVCLQSTPSTCGPASAANILKMLGQDTSEQQLATESFSYRGGTENWYLSRALRKRGFDTKVTIEFPLPSVLPAPSIAGVVLGGGAGHFIAVMSQDGSDVTIVDPLKGKIVIPRVTLEKQYRFTGFFLVVKKRVAP